LHLPRLYSPRTTIRGFQLAPGYGNIKFGIAAIGMPSTRHSGFVLDTNYNFTPMVGLDLFTGYYSLGNNSTLYTNTFGLNASCERVKKSFLMEQPDSDLAT
jgi:hypothetical protein